MSDQSSSHLPNATNGRYVRHPRAFDGDSGGTLIYKCRREGIPEEAHEFPLVLKMIPRSSMTSYVDMPDEDRLTQPPDTVAGFDEGMLELEIERDPSFKNALREATSLRDLNHPHILRFVESYWTKDHANIVTEFAPGGDLQRRMDERLANFGLPHYEEVELIPIIRIVCNTLHFVHDAGWAHRDLKPSKIMFRTQLNDDVVIAGFGFAILQVNIGGRKSMFTTTDVGTPEFKAPEQFEREGYGIAVDMWALGVTCFYLLTGQYPFQSGVPDFSIGPSIIDTLDLDRFDLSECAKLFIGDLLVWDPEDRMTSLEAGNHPWLAEKED